MDVVNTGTLYERAEYCIVGDDNSVKKYKVISLDMFQTLVNVDTRIEQIWKPILLEKYTSQVAKEYASFLLSYFFKHWKDLKSKGQFFLISEVYGRSFIDVFKDHSILNDPIDAVKTLFQEHSRCDLYEDTVRFLDDISKEYDICIVSDADDGMIPQFYKEFEIQIFTSERYQSYKNDDRNAMLKNYLKCIR